MPAARERSRRVPIAERRRVKVTTNHQKRVGIFPPPTFGSGTTRAFFTPRFNRIALIANPSLYGEMLHASGLQDNSIKQFQPLYIIHENQISMRFDFFFRWPRNTRTDLIFWLIGLPTLTVQSHVTLTLGFSTVLPSVLFHFFSNFRSRKTTSCLFACPLFLLLTRKGEITFPFLQRQQTVCVKTQSIVRRLGWCTFLAPREEKSQPPRETQNFHRYSRFNTPDRRPTSISYVSKHSHY